MLIALALLLTGGLYLGVNARLARAGRALLDLQSERAELQRQIEDLKATWAELTMPHKMLARARELGFEPARMQDIEYVVVEGYHPPAPFIAPRPPSSTSLREGSLSPAYTETLGDWLARLIRPREEAGPR